MLVSHSHKFIFVKTRKTASTSVECFLEQFCRPPGYIITEKTDMSETPYGIVGARLFSINQVTNLKWFHHLSIADIKTRLPNNIWDSYYKITTIRNTFDQIVSHWWWYYSRYNKNIVDLPFKNIKDQFKKDIFNSEVDISNLSVKNYVSINDAIVIDNCIRYDHLCTDLKELVNVLELPIEEIKLPKMKANMRKRNEPFQSYYDNETINFVYNKLKWDIDYFKYTV
jgi:hypothetical protein